MTTTADRTRAEIQELHAFFDTWFAGTMPNDGLVFDRFASVTAEGFHIIAPGGAPLDRDAILGAVFMGWGRGAMNIRTKHEIVRHETDELIVCTYEEWQVVDERDRGRLSTVVFRNRADTPNGLEWLHVHETWLPEAQA